MMELNTHHQAAYDSLYPPFITMDGILLEYLAVRKL